MGPRARAISRNDIQTRALSPCRPAILARGWPNCQKRAVVRSCSLPSPVRRGPGTRVKTAYLLAGEDTLWASGYELYDRLSPPYQKFFEPLTTTAKSTVLYGAAQADPSQMDPGPRGAARVDDGWNVRPDGAIDNPTHHTSGPTNEQD